MTPTKPLELLIDQFIEQDIRFWVEMRCEAREPEQTDFLTEPQEG